MNNPVHVLAASRLRQALGGVGAGPMLADRFHDALVGLAENDLPVLEAALNALAATGYAHDKLEGNDGFMNLMDAVQQATRVLTESTGAP